MRGSRLPTNTRRTRAKLLLFAAGAALLAVFAVVALLLAADLYAHSRVERSAGVNRRGYRGPVAGPKAPGEQRVVMIGGSTVFGWDVAWEETVPALLERRLQTRQPAVRVINLGFIGEGAHAFLPTLQDFATLQYDVAILYEGYNDLLGDARPNTDLYRHGSPIFRATGYFPILPMVLAEKAKALRYADVGAGYRAARGEPDATVFQPGLVKRTSAAALETASAVTSSLDRQLARMSGAPQVATPAGVTGCAPPWVHYCESVYAAVRYGVEQHKTMLVVAQPLLKNEHSSVHQQQQIALADMIARKFSGEPKVRYVDLRETVDLSKRDIAFDGMHLTPAGNGTIADALLDPVRQALSAR
jgi:lysophospholipase L1-like esterase